MDLITRVRDVFGVAHPLADPASFALFYQQTHAVVFRYVYMLHGSPKSDVEDYTAEAFARAWKQRHRFSGNDEAALGWIITIARRIVIDQQRRIASAATRQLDQADLPPTPEQQALLRERQHLALELLNHVSLTQRDHLIMRYFLGWRVQTIAQHLGSSESSVSVSIHRALKILQTRYPTLAEELFHDA
ncbi:RNA polymerase sigma factor [Herpetosiphon llansteffanensis]|uniref:RNA polymerase sigma factor n=1 Tax=Herpetosiphon llansteffanensis TaxID=2094568 RepID=UPI0013E00AC0|nr:sigma-70 family RNA polymerase sigma factor [Herpetosiphon llansteffanensis]